MGVVEGPDGRAQQWPRGPLKGEAGEERVSLGGAGRRIVTSRRQSLTSLPCNVRNSVIFV